MKYIYDLILNFNDDFYDFFEWNEEDNIEYIKRIPLFKVSNKTIRDLKMNKVILASDFIENINDKCEVYMKSGIGNIEYACLFCSNDSAIAIEFNYKGISIYKSDLIIDEALDIIDYCKKIKSIKLNYKIITESEMLFITRKENMMINFIKRELRELFENKNIDKIKYLYYECFNKIETNISRMNIDLESYMMKAPSKIFNILMLSYSKD